MKVVLFCGGLGTRLKGSPDGLAKPMVPIGYRPVLWHVMNYYAYYGHKDFILCLGYQADTIKQYFLSYNECISNDFILSNGGKNLTLLKSDIDDWNITFVDTGLNSNVGQRLRAVQKFVENEPFFLANYSDGLTDLHLPTMVDYCVARERCAAFVSVKPSQSFHVVTTGEDSLVTSICSAARSDIWINGGYFVLKADIFNYIQDGEELVEQPFVRLIEKQQLVGYRYEGFWAALDTFKDKQRLDDLYAKGEAPWEVWRKRASGPCQKRPFSDVLSTASRNSVLPS